MSEFDEPGAFQELLGEIKALRTDMGWIRSTLESQGANVVDIYDRLRALETDVASIKAGQKPPVSGWTIFGVVATIAVSILVILDRIYINQ